MVNGSNKACIKAWSVTVCVHAPPARPQSYAEISFSADRDLTRPARQRGSQSRRARRARAPFGVQLVLMSRLDRVERTLNVPRQPLIVP